MKSIRSIFAGLTAAVAVTAFAVAPAKAEFPSGTIQFVIPFGAGGGADIEGRLLAKEMGKILGVAVAPLNKVGGGGAVTYTYVKNSKPDGHTIAWNSSSILTTTNIGNVDFDYHALDHIGQVEFQPMPVAVKGNSPYKDLKGLIAACKAKPNTLKIAVSSPGSATHVAALALLNGSGCKAIILPVGIKRRNATVLSGEAQALVGPLTGTINLAKAKKLRILAILSNKRNHVIPDVPTAHEQGINAELDLFRGLSVAPGTPAAIKAKLFDAMKKAANSAAFTSLAKKKGFTIMPLDPAGFDKRLASEDKRVKAIMKSAGMYKSKKKK